MAYVYKITNDINEKVYIGKTYFSIEKRFSEHCKDSQRERHEKRPLYSAMQKYGIEHFHIELIEETDIPEERERYWIEFYNSYHDGYNATLGGDGKCLFDHKLLAKRLEEHPYICDVAKEFNCSKDLLRNIAQEYHIIIKNKAHETMQESCKTISAYDKEGKIVKTFSSTVEAAKWCYQEHKCANLNSGVRSHIAEVANGKRKSAYSYYWKYD